MEKLINNKVEIVFNYGVGAWREAFYKDLYVKGLRISDKLFDFELNFEVKVRVNYYLLYAIYTIKEHGKPSKGHWHWIGLFQTQEEAKEAAKEFDQSILPEYQERKPLTCHSGYCFPEHKERLQIDTVKVIDFND